MDIDADELPYATQLGSLQHYVPLKDMDVCPYITVPFRLLGNGGRYDIFRPVQERSSGYAVDKTSSLNQCQQAVCQPAVPRTQIIEKFCSDGNWKPKKTPKDYGLLRMTCSLQVRARTL